MAVFDLDVVIQANIYAQAYGGGGGAVNVDVKMRGADWQWGTYALDQVSAFPSVHTSNEIFWNSAVKTRLESTALVVATVKASVVPCDWALKCVRQQILGRQLGKLQLHTVSLPARSRAVDASRSGWGVTCSLGWGRAGGGGGQLPQPGGPEAGGAVPARGRGQAGRARAAAGRAPGRQLPADRLPGRRPAAAAARAARARARRARRGPSRRAAVLLLDCLPICLAMPLSKASAKVKEREPKLRGCQNLPQSSCRDVLSFRCHCLLWAMHCRAPEG